MCVVGWHTGDAPPSLGRPAALKKKLGAVCLSSGPCPHPGLFDSLDAPIAKSAMSGARARERPPWLGRGARPAGEDGDGNAMEMAVVVGA